MVIVSHKPEAQVLDCDQRIGVYELASSLMPEVAPLVGDMVVLLSDLESRLTSTSRAPLASGQPALLNAKLGEAGAQPARVLDQGAVRESKQAMQSYIYTDLGQLTLYDLDIWKLDLKEGVPLPEASFDDQVLNLCARRDLAVQLDLDLADVLDIQQRTARVVEPELTAIAVCELEALPEQRAFEAWESGFLAGLHAAKEGAVGLIQAPKSLLHTGEVKHAEPVWIRPAEVAKVLTLRDICDTRPGLSVRFCALFKRGVIHATRKSKQITQLSRLPRVWVEAVLIRPYHAPTRSPENVQRNSER